MSLYELKDLKQVFGNRTVLDIEHLHLDAGGSYALLGPNGSGKTTLLHILAFLSRPFSGQLFFSGQQVQWKEKYLYPLRRRVVLVDQHPIMFSTTVLKNVEYGPKMRGLSQANRSRLAVESLELVGMKEFAHRPAHLLSGGETQRVAIARAIACQPEVMLFDEPTASVDVENQAVIENIIQEIVLQGRITVVFSTHGRLQSTRLARERVFINKGRLVRPSGDNCFQAEVIKSDGRTWCVFKNLTLEVESGQPGKTGVCIDPERIFMHPAGKAPEHSGMIKGKILQMTADGGRVRVIVDARQQMVVISSRDRIARSGLVAGDEVLLSLRPDSVFFLPE